MLCTHLGEHLPSIRVERLAERGPFEVERHGLVRLTQPFDRKADPRSGITEMAACSVGVDNWRRDEVGGRGSMESASWSPSLRPSAGGTNTRHRGQYTTGKHTGTRC